MQMIFEKSPIKENGKLSKLFCLIPRGLNLPAGSDTPQNKILWGIKPRRTRSCVVSDREELGLARYQTQQNNDRDVYFLQQILVLRGLIPRRTMFCRPDAPPNTVLQGIRPRGTKFCGVSNPGEQLLSTIFSRIQNRMKKYFWV
jgi:hypothetical protein